MMYFSLLTAFIAAATVATASASPLVIDLADPASESIFEIQGTTDNEIGGTGLATADFDGDGIIDLCFSTPSYDVTVCSVNIFFGGVNRDAGGNTKTVTTDSDGFIRIDAVSPETMFGISCAGGDFNGDGFGDFAIGSPYEFDQGRVYVVFGKTGARGIKESTIGAGFDSCTLSGYDNSSRFGFNLSSGDFDNDGIDDIIIGSTTTGRNGIGNTGEASVIFGRRDMQDIRTICLAEDMSGSLKIMAGTDYMVNSEGQLGYSTASGDVDGDGFDDIIVSAPFTDPNYEPDSGTVSVVFGGPGIKNRGTVDFAGCPSGTLVITGKRAFHSTGSDLAVGDIDGDGFDDIIINANRASPDNRWGAGTTFVVHGSASLSSRGTLPLTTRTSDVITIMGEAPDAMMGPVATGDCNGDGFMDIVTGAPRLSHEAREYAGKGIIIYGSRGFFTRPVIDLLTPPPYGITEVYGAATYDYTGVQTIAGDFDGDGLSEAVFTTTKSYENPENKGCVYLLWGSRTPTPETNYFTYTAGTGASATLRAPSTISPDILGEPLEPGDIIGVFTPDGLCAGAGTWNGAGLDITVWGDNPATDAVDGFREDEPFAIRIFDVSDWFEFAAGAAYASGGGVFRHDSIVTLSGLTVTVSSGDAPVHFSPSPSGGSREKVLVRFDVSNYNFAPQFVSGDEIAAVTASGVCAGAGVWKSDFDLLLTVYGDDPATAAVEGFSPNEKMRFIRWDSATHEELALMAETAAGIDVEVYTPGDAIDVTHLHYSSLGVENRTKPVAFALPQNIPNPFNPSTTIRFSLEAESKVTLDVFAVNGAKIATLSEGVMSAGEHEAVWNATGFPSGVYFCRMKAGITEKTIKMTLVK